MATESHVAVFGDLHGHIRLMFQLCRLWQRHHGVKLDGILQVGDLGCYPDAGCVDRATRRFAEHNPEEVGFARFFAEPDPPETCELMERILTGDPGDPDTVTCPCHFTWGNHEDFDFLERLGTRRCPVPVDIYGALNFLPPGVVVDVGGWRVAGVGGRPERDDDRSRSPIHKGVDHRACDRLADASFDILLAHCAPAGVFATEGMTGSELLDVLVALREPVYTFYGHYSRVPPPRDLGKTRCIHLSSVSFRGGKYGTHGAIRPGCMGVLSGSPARPCFERVDEPWFHTVAAETWSRL